MGKAEIWDFSTSVQLGISHVSVVTFHIMQAMQRRKIVKMVNLGTEIKTGKKWNEKRLGPCMNVFLNSDPYTTLDLFHPKQWLQKRSNIKEIEASIVANRLWNSKMIKMKANSVLRASESRLSHRVIWTNKIPAMLYLFWAKRETTGKTNQY